MKVLSLAGLYERKLEHYYLMALSFSMLEKDGTTVRPETVIHTP